MKRLPLLAPLALASTFVVGCGGPPPLPAAGPALDPRQQQQPVVDGRVPVKPSGVQFDRYGQAQQGEPPADPEPGDPNANSLAERMRSEGSQYDMVPRPPRRPRVPGAPAEQPAPEYNPAPDRRPGYAAPLAVPDGSARQPTISPRPLLSKRPAPADAAPPSPGPVEPAPQPPVTRPAPPPVPHEPAQGRPLDVQPGIRGVTTAVDVLGQRLRERASKAPQDVAAQVDLMLYNLLERDALPDPAALLALPRDQREMITTVADGWGNWRNLIRRDGNLLPSEQIRPLLEMIDRLRAQAELTIPTVALCSRVVGFGVYDPMATTFRAGQDVPVIVYSEVANFSSRLNEKAMWETRLSMGAVLYTETGVAVWNNRSEVPPDTSRNRRHDFFVVKRVVLPRTMAVGRYILKVTISDNLANRVAENSIEITMTAQ